MWHQRVSAALTIVVLAGGGLWLLGYGWTQEQTDRRLDQGAAVVEGRVIRSSTQRLSKGGQSSTLVVEYTPVNHPAITREFAVDGDAYRAAQATGRAKVTYVPEEPRISRVTDFARLPFQLLIVLGGVMSLAALAGLVQAWKRGPGPRPK